MVYFLILFGFIMRIASHFHQHPLLAPLFQYLPDIPNFAPIAALALFSGVYLKGKYALIIPLTAMLVSDYFIGFYNPYIMLSVYFSFGLIGLMGVWLKKNKTVTSIFAGSLLGSVLFFLITNFAVWVIPNSYYPHTITGLLDCYVMALPFFRNSLTGDLFYAIILFGAYETASFMIKKHTKEALWQR
ncbi:MAG TPA: hypothetical protein PLE96_02505 [bacterium]|nr:hypothetical protein [bacterium]